MKRGIILSNFETITIGQESKGATAEKAVAEWSRKEVIFDVKDGPEDVLIEALRITGGDRQSSYGPPDQDFRRTAGMWTA